MQRQAIGISFAILSILGCQPDTAENAAPEQTIQIDHVIWTVEEMHFVN